MLIAEDLLLLLTDDRTGKLVAPANQVDLALGGALLVELALAQRVDVAGEHSSIRKGRLLVTDGSPASDALLDDALALLQEKQGKKPKDVVPALGKGLRARLHARLAAQGILHEENGKILRLFPTHRWPSSDAAPEESLRALLAEALRDGTTDDPHVAALVSLLHALKATPKVVHPAAVGITKNEMNANASKIAQGNWGSEAVREALDAMLTSVIAATGSSVVVVSGGA
jgi:hypothetical protein